MITSYKLRRDGHLSGVLPALVAEGRSATDLPTTGLRDWQALRAEGANENGSSGFLKFISARQSA
ncbi:MAG TPA: hypothetical protein VJ023_17255, partial [Pyrinomonadaceae bacterium]|nr:hypothetical protein [Pyrinomonadaceae bacterium]